MKNLGFLMNKNKRIKFFGEYREQYDKNNRHQVHDFSFTDEVESSSFFEALGICYDRDKGLYGKAIDLSLQGLIMLLNISNKNKNAMVMYVPTEDRITSKQEDKLHDIYGLLKSFDDAKIVVPKSVFITDDDCFFCVDDFYNFYGIEIGNKSKRLVRH